MSNPKPNTSAASSNREVEINNEVSEMLREAETILARNNPRLKLKPNQSQIENINNMPVVTKEANEISQLTDEIDSVIDQINNSLAGSSSTSSSSSNIEINDNSVIEVQNDNSSNSNSSQPDIDDSVIFVNENRLEVIDLCSPSSTPIQTRKRRDTNNVIVINDYSDFNTSGTPKQARLDNQHIVQNSPDSSEQIQLKCPICMDSCRTKTPTSTPCGHIYCHRCITTAIKNAKKCPLCNKQVAPKQLIKLYIP